MFDKEIEAIAKCAELIKDLDDNSKFRVLEYLIKRFEIGTNIPKSPYLFNNTHLANHDNDEEFTPIQSKLSSKVLQDEFPTLKQLLIKNLPKNEPEWILCFAFYCSKFGEDTFTKDEIVDKYKEANKYTVTNRKNFTQNLNACMKKDWLKDYNKNEYILKEDGIAYAKEIMNGNSLSKEIKRIKRSKGTSSEND